MVNSTVHKNPQSSIVMATFRFQAVSPIPELVIFQQYKDLKLTSKLCQVYLYSQGEQGVLTCMAFPPQSLYVKSIERLWEQY